MVRSFVSAVFVLSVAAALPLAQDKGFSGVWEYQPSKSIPPKPEGLQLSVTAQPAHITVTRRYVMVPGSDETMPGTEEKYTCTTDGTPTRAARGPDTVTWTVRWQGQTLMWRAQFVREADKASVDFTERWTLSADGRTLTIDRIYLVSAEVVAVTSNQVREVFTRQRQGR